MLETRLVLCSSPKSRLGHLALCQVALSDGHAPEWVQLIPAGEKLNAFDGRKFTNKDPQSVIDAFNADPRDLPIDWEHSTEKKAVNGEEAPAAGWGNLMELRDGAIWCRVEWTPRGRADLESKEYRYISPAFITTKLKNIIEIVSAGLTNRQALNLPALARSQSSIDSLPDTSFLIIQKGGSKDSDGMTSPRTLRHFPFKDELGDLDADLLEDAIARIPQLRIPQFSNEARSKLLKHAQKLLNQAEGKLSTARTEETMDNELLAILGLTEEATAEEIKAALLKMKAGPEAELETTKKELETASAKIETLGVELTNAREANPSLDKFVPRSDYDAVVCRANTAEAEIETSKNEAHKALVDAEIDAACRAGKMTPASKGFYVDTCSTKEGLEKFRSFVKDAPVIGKVSDLSNSDPKNKETLNSKLTATEMLVAKQCGQTPEQFITGRA